MENFKVSYVFFSCVWMSFYLFKFTVFDNRKRKIADTGFL